MSSSLETFDSCDELLSSLELTNSKISTSELLITSESVKHQIDNVNPYVKLLGSTDIMSESGKKTSTVSPDQGTTGEPATPKREGTAEKTKQTPRKYQCVRSEELFQLVKKLNKKIEPGQGLLTLTWVSEHLETLTLEAEGASQIT